MISSSPSPEALPIEHHLPIDELHSKEGIREYYDLKDDIQMNTREGELHLLERMEEKHPELNGRLEEAYDYVARLYRQHQVWDEVKDETRSAEEPEAQVLESKTPSRKISKAQMEKHKGFFARHPVLTTTALALLAYFFGPTLMKNGVAMTEDVLAKVPFDKVGEGVRSLFGLGGGVATGRPPIIPTPETL